MQPRIEDTLFGKYFKEYYNGNVIESDKGFILYYIQDDACIIDDLYVLPEYRKLKEANNLAAQVEFNARLHNCKYLEAESYLDSRTYEQSISAMKFFGFKKVKEDKDRRIELWRKEI